MVNEDGSVTLTRDEFNRLMERSSDADHAEYFLTMAYVLIIEPEKHTEEELLETKEAFGHYVQTLAEKLQQLRHAHIVNSPLFQEMVNDHGLG